MAGVWPGGKQFAFTVFDDTDFSTVENTKPVYDLLAECGFRTTKSCWVREPGSGERGNCPGMTAEVTGYRNWLLDLQRQGTELGLHNVSCASSTRQQTLAGFDRFEQYFGHPPQTLANHSGVRESIYWGNHRVTGVCRLLYNLLTRLRHTNEFDGHIESSPGFWGDICKQRVEFVRNFTFRDINTLKMCPFMPYHDPLRPYVNHWFASSDGHDLASFVSTISEQAQDRLEEEGGACIMYTHFAVGFCEQGRVDGRFAALMRRLARKNGWFVPVGDLLHHLGRRQGFHTLTRPQRRRLEFSWLWDKIHVGHS